MVRVVRLDPDLSGDAGVLVSMFMSGDYLHELGNVPNGVVVSILEAELERRRNGT